MIIRLRTQLITLTLLSLVTFSLFHSRTVCADSTIATYPSNGATNVPQNLDGHGYCSTTNNGKACTLVIGVGVTPSYLNKNSTITVSSPSDSGLSVKWAGESEGWGHGDGFYHSSYYYITTNDTPHGTILMPNTTYTITVNDGYGINSSWSFTTANGSMPARLPPQQASPDPSSSSSNTTSRMDEGSLRSLEERAEILQQQNQVSPSASPSSSPSSKPVIKKSSPSPSLSPSDTPNESPLLESPQPTNSPIEQKRTFFQIIRNFFADVYSKFFKH